MLADKIAANRARYAAQAASHEARRLALGLAPRGRLKIDLAGRHAGTFTVPATWSLWGSVTTPDGITGALYRENGGVYWQAADDFFRTLHVEDVRASLHGPKCDPHAEAEWCAHCGSELMAGGGCDNDHADPEMTAGAPYCWTCGESLEPEALTI